MEKFVVVPQTCVTIRLLSTQALFQYAQLLLANCLFQGIAINYNSFQLSVFVFVYVLKLRELCEVTNSSS
jgi:hypothetical protein